MFGTRRKTATVIAVAAAASSVLVPVSPVTAADHGYLHDGYARLHHAKGFHNARGPVTYHSDYDSHHAGMDEEFHLVLRGVKKLAGKRMRVFVHGDLVGRVWVNDDGAPGSIVTTTSATYTMGRAFGSAPGPGNWWPTRVSTGTWMTTTCEPPVQPTAPGRRCVKVYTPGGAMPLSPAAHRGHRPRADALSPPCPWTFTVAHLLLLRAWAQPRGEEKERRSPAGGADLSHAASGSEVPRPGTGRCRRRTRWASSTPNRTGFVITARRSSCIPPPPPPPIGRSGLPGTCR